MGVNDYNLQVTPGGNPWLEDATNMEAWRHGRRALAFARDALDVSQRAEIISAASWARSVLSAGIHVDTVEAFGVHTSRRSEPAVGLPFVDVSATVEVLPMGNSYILQRVTSEDGRVSHRVKGGGIWGAWQPGQWTRGLLAAGAVLDDLRDPGAWQVRRTAPIVGLPFVDVSATVEVLPMGNSYILQRVTSETGETLGRVNAGGIWSTWTGGGSGLEGALSHTTPEIYGGWTSIDELYRVCRSLDAHEHVTVEMIGQTVNGKEIPGLIIGDPSKPAFLAIGSQHGNEPSPTPALLAWARELLAARNVMLMDMSVMIVPMVNVDSWESSRYNANGVDLNRDWFDFSQPETRAIRDWIAGKTILGAVDGHSFGYARQVSLKATYLGTAQVQDRSQQIYDAIFAAVSDDGNGVREYEPDSSEGTMRNGLALRGIPGITLEIPARGLDSTNNRPVRGWQTRIGALSYNAAAELAWTWTEGYKTEQAPVLPAPKTSIADLEESIEGLGGDIAAMGKELEVRSAGGFDYHGPVTAPHVNDVTTPGRWTVLSGSAASSLGMPIGLGGVLDVIPWGSFVLQVYRTSGGNFQRMSGSTGWFGWTRAGGLSDSDLGLITSASDPATMTTPGRWYVGSGAVATELNLPDKVGGVFEVIPWGRFVTQTYQTSNGLWHRWQASAGWLGWKRISAREDSDTASLSASAALDTMKAPGRWSVLSGTTAGELNLPEAVGGIFEVTAWGAQAVQTYQTVSATWQRWSGSTGWHAWRRIDHNIPTVVSITAAQRLDDLKTPMRGQILSGSTATTVGAPVGVGGLFAVEAWGSLLRQSYVTLDSNWERWSGSTGWHPWERTDARDFEDRVKALIPAVSTGPTTKGIRTVPLSLTLSAGNGLGVSSATVRIPLRFEAPITRWRLHIRNRMPRYGETGLAKTDPFTFSAAHVGDSAGNGRAAGLTRAASIPAIPSGSSDTVTPWVSDVPIGSGRDQVLSFSYTGSTQPHAMVGGGWTTETGKESEEAPAALVRQQVLPFQVWLEAETPTATPVLAGLGDSLTCGVGATLPVHDSWLSVHCRKAGALPVHYAASGDYMGGWEDPTAYKWAQWEHLDRPDAVVFAMGSNDMNNQTLGELQRRHSAVMGLVKKRLSSVVYASTIMPRTSMTESFETVRRQYNAWLGTQPNGIRDLFDFAGSISTDDETIIPAYDADGIHLTTQGYALNAAAITRPVTPPAMATATSVAATVAAGKPADTGWRDITALAGSSITAGKIYLRRHGAVVELVLDGVTVASTATGRVVLFTLPDGWRPRFTMYATTTKFWTADIAEPFTVSPTTGSTQFESLASGQILRGDFVWTTENTTPAVAAYPGTTA